MIEEDPAAAGQRQAPVSRRRLLTMLGVGAAGGIAAGGIAGALIANRPGSTAGWQLQPVPAADLPQVSGTLAPDAASRLLEAARRCREPLARVAIWHTAATPGGAVSILSGSYRSPSFTLTTTPSLVAFPFPTPYRSGHGVLIVVGAAHDFGIALKPVYVNAQINGSLPIRVWWTPVGGCP